MSHLGLIVLVALTQLGAAAEPSVTPETLGETVTVFRGLAFAQNPGGALLLDLYVPRDTTALVPAIVVIPGGGFRAQSREKFAKEAQRFAEAGFAAASIGYRGTPGDTFKATIADTKAAVRFLRANAARYSIDPEHIGSFGQSAGGHLAVMLAVSGGEESLEGDGGNPDASSRVQAAVSFSGVFDFVARLKTGGQQQQQNLETKRKSNGAWVGEAFSEDSALWQQASPWYHVSAGDPPVLFVHCKDDQTVPFQQSVDMCERMQGVQKACRLLLFEQGGHGIRSAAGVQDEAFQQSIDFFRTHLAGTGNAPE